MEMNDKAKEHIGAHNSMKHVRCERLMQNVRRFISFSSIINEFIGHNTSIHLQPFFSVVPFSVE